MRSFGILRSAARASALVAATVALAACGRTASIHGTADEAWRDTLDALRDQGMLTEEVEALAADPKRRAPRPSIDREAGEIDLPFAKSVYYGDGAAFIQVDVDDPVEVYDRTVRVWVDYPVGLRVVRYGRAMDEAATERFERDFSQSLDRVRARRAGGGDSSAHPAAPPHPTTP